MVLDADDSTVGQASEGSRSREGGAAGGDQAVAGGDAVLRGSRDAADAVADGLSAASARGSSPERPPEGDRGDRAGDRDSSELSVAEARRRFPEVARALENAGAQAREAQLRRDAGSRESTRQRVAAIRARLAELPEEDSAGLDFVWENARANASDELMRAMASNAIETFNPSPEERASLEAAIADQRGEGLREYAMQLVTLAADRVGRRSLYELSIDELPAESRLAQSIREREERRLDAERRAAAIERRASGRTPPPPTPAGRPVGTNAYDLNNPFDVLRANREGYFGADGAAAEALDRAFEGN